MLQIFIKLLFTCLLLISSSTALPVESKPLNNNPDSWNLYFMPHDSLNPSAEALIGNDPHIKKSKITPKSIFIAPNKNFEHTVCPNGYRIDDYGKCIKTVTVNQEDIFISRLAELFGEDDSMSKATISDSDYYDMFEDEKNSENAGPLQISIPLLVDVEIKDGKKKMELEVIDEKITVKDLPSAEKIIGAPITEKISVENIERTTTTQEITSTSKIEETTTEVPVTTITESTTTTTTTQAPSTILPFKLTNVEYLPKFTRKSNRTRVRTRQRKPKPTMLTSSQSSSTKKTRLRNGSKRRKSTTTTTTTTEIPVTQKPFYWLPKGWTIDETNKEKPVLIKFWSDTKAKNHQEDRARSHGSRSQRMNSRKPSDEFFKEVSVPELEDLLSPK